jgi:hypothetical protein
MRIKKGTSIAKLYLVAKPLDVHGAKATHQYIAYVDSDGKESQIHGLAFDKKTSDIKTVGKKGDKLKSFIIDEKSEHYEKHFEKNGLNTYPNQLLFSGEDATIKWCISKKVVSDISNEDSKYDPIAIDKPNSNSVAATICSVLGVKPVALGYLATPGLKKAIFSKEKYETLYKDQKDALKYDFYSGTKAATDSIYNTLKGNGINVKEKDVEKAVNFVKNTGLDKHIGKGLETGKFDGKKIMGSLVKGFFANHSNNKNPEVDISGKDSDEGNDIVDFLSSFKF